MAVFLTILWLGVIIAWIVGLVKPTVYSNLLFAKANRKKISMFFGLLFVTLFVGIGITAPPQTTNTASVVPNSPSPSVQVIKIANEPAEPASSSSPTPSASVTPSPTPTPTPTPNTSTYVAPAASTPTSSSCNPNYTPCVPNSSTDLDCKDIKKTVHVIGTDVYHFDADHDGIGCESYS